MQRRRNRVAGTVARPGPTPPSMRVRTRRFDEAEHVPPTESSSLEVLGRVTKRSASRATDEIRTEHG
jgi:hypothetical protein